MLKQLLTILLLIPCILFGQSITAPPGRTYQVNVSGQDASGFVISGFTSEILLTSIGLVNPPSGTSFSIKYTGSAPTSGSFYIEVLLAQI